MIIPDGKVNRWRILHNSANKVEIHYEGLCSMVGDWVCIAQLLVDDRIIDEIGRYVV